jgi:putative two-component system response regulator
VKHSRGKQKSFQGQSVISEEETAERLIREAERLVADALATGLCSDARLLEASVLAIADLHVDQRRRLQIMLDSVRFMYVSGNVQRGLTISARAKTLALGAAAPDLATDALMYCGICSADTGALSDAMECYDDALKLAQNNGFTGRETKIWLNLGAALLYAGLYREAIECFRKCLLLAASNQDPSFNRASPQINIALCHLNLDEIQQGLTAIKEALVSSSVTATGNQLLNRVLLENYYTRLLIEIDDFEGATARAKIGREFANQSKSPRADITASVAEGLAEVFSGKADVGISRLTRTYERAKTLKFAAREALVAIVKAYEYVGQHDKALEYLKEMLSALKHRQEANALQHVRRHLEQLHDLKKDSAPIEDASQAIKRLATKQEVFEGRIAKRELFRQSVESLERLAVATELRDDSTGEHSYRVGRMASLLAKEAGCDDDTVFMIDIAARLHDIGKIAIPDGILLKPSSFNNSEREIMKMHAEAGADVLAKSNIPQIQMAEEIARYHHEKWDGTGYPHGLAGEAIPLAARITALADVFDALTHVRPYKLAWSVDSALTEILSVRGTHFDPRLTDLFLGLVSRLVREGVDLDYLLGEAARKSSFNQAKGKIWDSLKLAKEEYQAKTARALDLQR